MQFWQTVDLTEECGFDDGITRTAVIRYTELMSFEEIDDLNNMRMSTDANDTEAIEKVGRTFAKIVKSWDIPDPKKPGERLESLHVDPTVWRKVPQIVLMCIITKATEEVPVPFRNVSRSLAPSTQGEV